MSFLKHLSRLSDTMKLTIGFAGLLLVAAIGIAATFSIIASSDSSANNDQPTTSGELYAQELLFHEVAQLPANAVAIEESPGEPRRYYLLRSWLESQDVEDTDSIDIAALHYPHEENEQ